MGSKAKQVSRRKFLGWSAGSVVVVAGAMGKGRVAAAAMDAGVQAGAVPRKWKVEPSVANKVTDRMTPLEYAAQQLDGESLLGRRLDNNLQDGLIGAVDLNSYLRPYRDGSRPLWPAGEFLGKFMQGYSRMYQYSGNTAILDRMNTIVRTWIAVQKEDGWVGTGDRWATWDVWEHKYTLLGFLDHYALTGDQRSLTAAKKIGDLISDTFGEGKKDLVRNGSWGLGSGSILEPMTYLYRYTGDEKYLRFCEYVIADYEGPTGPKIITTLTRGSKRVYDIVDPISRWHNGHKGYEMLSCIIGIVRMYQLTRRQEYLTTATNAWQDITTKRLYITGTSTSSETFRDDHVLPGETADEVGEGCVTAHWIFLNRILFQITGDAKYLDTIERSLYNHLLASQSTINAHQAYFTPLNGSRVYEVQNIWSGKPPCCLSSVTRCISRIPEVTLSKFDDQGIAVLLYNKGKAADRVMTRDGEMLLPLEIDTDFPKSGRATIRMGHEKAASFRLALRVPAWTTGFVAKVGGQDHRGTAGTFLEIDRTWNPGDTVEIEMEMNDRLIDAGSSYPGFHAFQHGPQILALDGKLTTAALGEVRVHAEGKRHGGAAKVELLSAPQMLAKGWTGDQAYTTTAMIAQERAVLVPFADAGQDGPTHIYRTWIKGV